LDKSGDEQVSGTLTETDSVILYETHEGKGTGSAYDGGMARLGKVTAEYTNFTRGTDTNNIVVKFTSVYKGFLAGTGTKGSQLISGIWAYKNSTGTSFNGITLPAFMTAGVTGSCVYMGYRGDELNTYINQFGSSTTFRTWGAEAFRQQWYYTLSSCGINSDRDFCSDIFLENDASKPFSSIGHRGSVNQALTSSFYAGFKEEAGGGTALFDNNSIMKGIYGYGVNVDGLTAGMVVTIEDSTGVVKGSGRATGSSVIVPIDKMIMPLIGKFKVYGTDGILQYTSGDVNIFYGTTWTYSGDYKTLVPTTIGTITFENGTTGSTGWLKFTPSNAESYDIYRGDTVNLDFAKIGNTTGGTYEDTGLENNHAYQYYVIGTSIAGYSLPSKYVYGFVYNTDFNYTNNILAVLQNQIKANITDLMDVRIGQYNALPEQLPLCEIMPDIDNEDAVTVGYSGQYDKVFNINIRLFTNGSGQTNETTILEATNIAGKVKALLETLKSYPPYWYLSDVITTGYGECVKDGQVLKYIEISWQCKRRINRN